MNPICSEGYVSMLGYAYYATRNKLAVISLSLQMSRRWVPNHSLCVEICPESAHRAAALSTVFGRGPQGLMGSESVIMTSYVASSSPNI
jgi:hypothetical protein